MMIPQLLKVLIGLNALTMSFGVWPFTSAGISSQTPIVSDLATLELLSGGPRLGSSSIFGPTNPIFGSSTDMDAPTKLLEAITKNAAVKTNQEYMLMNNLANFAALRRSQLLREGAINGTNTEQLLHQLSPSGATIGMSSPSISPLASILGIPSTGIGTIGSQIPFLDTGSLSGRLMDPNLELASLLRTQVGTQILPLSEFSPVSNGLIVPGQIPPGFPTAIQQINEDRLRNQFRILGADPRLGSIAPPSRPRTSNFASLGSFDTGINQLSPFKALRRSNFFDEQPSLRNPFENSSGLLKSILMRREGFDEQIGDVFTRPITMKDSVIKDGISVTQVDSSDINPEQTNTEQPI